MKEITSDHNKKGVIASDEYYTPPEFVERLGHFDTDPATPVNARWRTADVMYNKIDDGLTKEWQGRVFLNPPYSLPLIEEYMKRMGEHHNAIALIIPKFGTKMFMEIIYPHCGAIFILKERVKFYNIDYIQQRSPVCQSMLVIYGRENILAVKNSGLQGNRGTDTVSPTKNGVTEASFWNTISDREMHAIRFLGTPYCSAWKYERMGGILLAIRAIYAFRPH